MLRQNSTWNRMVRSYSTGVKLRSRMFIPTIRQTPKQSFARSHELLLRAGFINQNISGVFHWLPLGERVLKKIETLIDQELQGPPLYAEKLRLSALSNGTLWKESGRWEMYGDELFRLRDRKNKDLCIGPTFEEEITNLVASLASPLPAHCLPLKLYQVSTKFRDEIRPRYGLLRSREFIMKDMYTFHRDKDCALRTYKQVVDAYERIFNTLGLDTFKVIANSGQIGGDHSHEFQALAKIGEDDIVYCDTGNYRASAEMLGSDEVKRLKDSPGSIQCSFTECSCNETGILELKRGIEVGQAFLLNTKYSDIFKAHTQSKDGKRYPMEMGCYGIGVSRLIAAVIESPKGNDLEGLIWPSIISPYDFVIMSGSGNENEQENMHKNARAFIDRVSLELPNSDAVYDDRIEKSFGSRLNEAKLIGYPRIFIFGKLFYESKMVEVINRNANKTTFIHEDGLLESLKKS